MVHRRAAEQSDPSRTPQILVQEDEAGVVERIRSGDAAAFEMLVRAHIVPLTRFAESLLGPGDDARDVVQDVLSRVWLRRETWQPSTTLAGYLYGAVRNTVFNVHKHARVERKFEDHTRQASSGEPSVDPVEPSDERLTAVSAAMATLTERQRSALHLRFARALTMPEVASALNIQLGAAEKLVGRALAAVRAQIRAGRGGNEGRGA